jgi:hypothetical protein
MACDVITLVRQECKELNLTQQPKRTGSASARVMSGDKEKKRISSQAPNVFHPLRDMGIETTKKKNHDIDEFTSIEQYQENRHLTKPKQQHIENWLDETTFESSCKIICLMF